jgi:hypothetical protein
MGHCPGRPRNHQNRRKHLENATSPRRWQQGVRSRPWIIRADETLEFDRRTRPIKAARFARQFSAVRYEGSGLGKRRRRAGFKQGQSAFEHERRQLGQPVVK